MYLLFLDESGKIDQGGLFALGGIAIRDADWPELRARWQQTLRDARWPLEREIKWHGIRTGAVPPELADAVFAMLAEAPFTAYVTLLDQELGVEREPDFFRTPEDVYATGSFHSGKTVFGTRATGGRSTGTSSSPGSLRRLGPRSFRQESRRR